MHLTQTQQNILFAIQSDRRALPHFEVLCAHLEAALDAAEDADATPPLGVAAIVSAAPDKPVTVADASTVIAVAWLAAIAEAVNDQDGEIDPAIFDEDGVPSFTDVRPLFEVAAACGFAPGRIRVAFARVRKDGAVPRRALKVLGTIGAIRPRKRKERLRGLSRVVPLAAHYAAGLDRDEIARAKAGSICYSLIARSGGYEAVRIRKTKARIADDDAGDPLAILSEGDADLMDGFSVPLIPCEGTHGLALAHFVEFLARPREDKPGFSYQRLVHRAFTA